MIFSKDGSPLDNRKFRFSHSTDTNGLDSKYARMIEFGLVLPIDHGATFLRAKRDDGFELLILVGIMQQNMVFKLRFFAVEPETGVEYTRYTEPIYLWNIFQESRPYESSVDTLNRIIAFKLDQYICAIFGRVEYSIARNEYGRIL